MSFRLKIVLMMGIALALACAGMSFAFYQSQRAHLLNEIDARLLLAAHCAQLMLPEGYHGAIVDRTSVAPEQFEKIVGRHNDLCTRFGLQYIWSCLQVGTQVVFTTSTSPSLDVSNDDHAHFYEIHKDPEAFRKVFGSMTIDYSTFRNQWGEGRMVLVPYTDARGRKYCFGASVGLDTVKLALGQTLLNGIFISLAVLAGGLMISYMLAGTLARPVHDITDVAERIARGDLQQEVSFKGCKEVEGLSTALNWMTAAIREKITEVEERSEQLRITLNSIGDAVIATDAQGRIQRMNPVAERLTGWSASEAAGRPLQEVFRTVDAETREESDDFVNRILETGEVLDIAVDRLLLARDGQEYLVADSGAPILSRSGEMEGVVFVFRDVTAQRELETQLNQVQKIEAIGQLAGGIAHDFNNQLAGIVGFADVLVSSAKDEDTRMCAGMILKTAQQAAELTRQLLAFARRGQYEKQPVDMHEAIRTATALLSRSVDRRIEIVTKLVAVEHTVRGDRSQLENAMLNLGLNACDAMREGGRLTYGTDVVHLDPEYCERVAFEVEPGRHLRVTISDTGQGMTPEVLGRIFEPFFTTKGPGEGTGMGLAAVYGAVTQHGGAIDVKSSPGRGTTFSIYLPLTRAAPERPGSYALPEETANVRDKHILVVDDEATLRTLLGNMLKPLGHEVTTMGNGEEAVAYYRENWDGIDLVILDMVMPKMNGKQAFAAMQNVNPGVKVLVISGYSVDDDTEQLLQAGARGFMQKPFSVRELRATVNRILQS